jgi:GNAT superfamily N-acetyltransferase
MGDNLHITTDKDQLDIALIHNFLSTGSTWAKGIPLSTVRRSIEHSLCFGGYASSGQVAFARVISDFATFANLVDVFVLPGHRGKDFGKRMVDAVMAHPDLQGLRRFTLATADAHELYARHGFTTPHYPEMLMEIYRPGIYQSAQS